MRLLPDPDFAAIEAEYLAAIETGNASGLRLGALTGATGLVMLRRQAGRAPDGGAELAAIYRGFTEGHDEDALITARDALADLLS